MLIRELYQNWFVTTERGIIRRFIMYRRDLLQSVPGILAGGTASQIRTSSSTAFSPLGTLSISGTKEAVVDSAGETAFVAVTDGFAVVDVRDPADPTLLTEKRNLNPKQNSNSFEQIYDVKVDDDRLLVAGPANPVSEAPRGVLLYDVSQPSAPERLAFFETDFAIHNCFLHDGRAYLTGNNWDENPLVIVDISGERPEEVGRWSMVDYDSRWADVAPLLRVVHDIWVQGNRAYVTHWDAGTWILDVSDPRAPTVVSRIGGRSPEDLPAASSDDVWRENVEAPSNHHYVTVNEDASILGISIESWDMKPDDDTGSVGWVELWDISTPTTPRQLTMIAPPPTSDPSFDGVWTTAHNFDIAGRQLYTAWYRGGVTVHDISRPSRPTEIAAWRDSSVASFWTAQQADSSGFFIASSWEGTDDTTNAGLYTFPDPRPSTPTPSPTSTPDSSRTEAPASGFGLLPALGGVAVGGWRYYRSRSRR